MEREQWRVFRMRQVVVYKFIANQGFVHADEPVVVVSVGQDGHLWV